MPRAKALTLEDLDMEYLWDRAIKSFWPNVDGGWEDVNRCWTWQGTFMTSGYGELGFRGGKLGAHRFAHLLLKGDLAEGMVIRHLCDNRACVNPFHLEQGTYAENYADTLIDKAELAYWMGKVPDPEDVVNDRIWDEIFDWLKIGL